ncbi:MAG TPA: beta-galactosidase [Acidimicrobiales bacterium]|nr:beta-galactosidase [Acidimicrobiales bacterium]
MTRGGIRYGGDYNPEQWPEEVWAEDVALMAEAGVDLVTVGVFAWGELQSGPGRDLDAGWLDRVLTLLHDGGVGVDLATATASPPPWLVAVHPEILPVTATGVRLSPGGRQHYCPSSPAYRAAAVDLASRLAERYGDHPALELWHIGNEYGCHVPACYCDVSAAAFRTWLRRRYDDDIDGLNRAWGTAFWSQRYRSFDEVLPPRAAPTFPNPTHQLDYARFSNDELLACYAAEKEVLRAATPAVPVTTNLMGLFRPTDGWAWAAAMDLVSVDRYPDPADPDAHVGAALVADLTRSLGNGRPWYLMEQAPGAVNWRGVNAPKARGQFRTWSLQAVARGADAVLQFQWRASAAGAEKFHSGMLPHAGTDTRMWRDVVALGADLQRLQPVAGTPVGADAAMLLDWESWWGLELDSHPSADLRQADLLVEMYRPLFDAGIVTDVAHPAADLSGYRLVVVPWLYLVSDAAAANLAGYVRDGGVAVVTYFSGIVDPHDRIRLGGYPAPWQDLLGLRVEEFAPMAPGETDGLAGPLAHPGSTARRWQERVQGRGARTLLTVATGPLTGQAAATVHDHGRGAAYYLATSPDPATLASVLAHAASRAGVAPVAPVPPGVEAVGRGGHLFLINHSDGGRSVDLGDTRRRDLLTGSLLCGAVDIGPGEALVLAPAGASAVTPTEAASGAR